MYVLYIYSIYACVTLCFDFDTNVVDERHHDNNQLLTNKQSHTYEYYYRNKQITNTLRHRPDVNEPYY